MSLKVTRTALEGVLVVEPAVYGDARGSFCETFSEREFASAVGVDAGAARFVQDNESHSRRDVIRGLHFQKPPHAQAKLVRVVSGAILDVAVDMRRDSATFGRWVAVELSGENHRQLYIPRGFAHGFRCLTDQATVIYKVDDFYAPDCDAGVRWDDAALGVDWGLDDPAAAIISDKDAALPALAEAYKF